MKARLLASSVVVLATFALPTLSASAQVEAKSTDARKEAFQAFQTTQQFDTVVLPSFSAALDLSARVHDDWAVASAPIALPLDLSPRIHDDWAVALPSAAPSLDLSPRSHDDWPVRSAE